ncbi:MAG: L-threonylcarbamoyladenylate synthase [Thermomicrobiales bacterium]
MSHTEQQASGDMAAVVAAGPEALQQAAEILTRGGLVVFPTDTVYGVAARLDRPAALARLYEAKGRPSEKAIPVLVSGAEQLARLTRDLPPGAAAFAARFWPGALTIVLPRSDTVPDLVTAGGDTVGLRMPDHPFALDLIARCGGALAVTSANRSGEPSLAEASAVAAAIGAGVDLIVDGGRAPGGQSSTVVALTSAGPRVLREGPISAEALRAAWASRE